VASQDRCGVLIVNEIQLTTFGQAQGEIDNS
jgi:hypothetical protein